MAYRLGIDVGGTFTDLLLVEEASGRTTRAKVPSTPADPSRAILMGIEKIANAAGIGTGEIGAVLHGTTVATNAILEGKGARVGLITTEGFRDVLHIARSHIPGGLGGWITHPKPEALAPLELTIEAPERLDKDGKALVELDEAEMRRRLARFRGRKVEAITIALFNSYIDGRHEQRIRTIVEDEFPGVPVSLSSEVLPEMLEYERAQTTVVNSYVRPIVSTYLTRLDGDLRDRGLTAKLHVLRSDGGLSSPEYAATFPVNLLMSGPAGGVAGAQSVARQAGYANLLTLDMGGTSTDVALIERGMPKVRRDTTVGDVTARASCLDVRTIGAGGGSIAHVPSLTRALRVGPQSAGADPGPALYGRGGDRATVSDANAVLGYLPDVRLAGEMMLDYAAAERAVQAVADALGVGLHRAAQGIVDIVNENMFGALRAVSVQQGYDPREFALFAFGGAGPLHANALARLMQSWPAIVPPAPGVLCAYGDAITHERNEASRTLIRRLDGLPVEVLAATLDDLAEKAAVPFQGGARRERSVRFEVDCRYHGQGLTLSVPIVLARLLAEGLGSLAAAFDSEHRRVFTFSLDEPREIINLRAIVEVPATPVEPLAVPPAASPDPSVAEIGRSRVHIDGDAMEARVFERGRLGAGHQIRGPAIFREPNSTTLVLPGHVAVVDHTGCLIIRPIES